MTNPKTRTAITMGRTTAVGVQGRLASPPITISAMTAKTNVDGNVHR
jgi:hypothetical protein